MKKYTYSILLSTVGALIALLVNTSAIKKRPFAINAMEADVGFVVLELFTSQGCSSCPPADELLGKYANQNNSKIIPLAFHVDYWNRLGWKDSFSTSGYSQRQREYAQSFSNGSVYTPQVVINGTKEIVGSDEDKIGTAVTKALAEIPAAIITINSNEISGEKISVQYSINGNVDNSNILTLLIQNKASTKIRAGENSGATLTSHNVVRSLVSAPAKKSGNCTFQIPFNIETRNLSVVLFTQNRTTLKITGAIKKSL